MNQSILLANLLLSSCVLTVDYGEPLPTNDAGVPDQTAADALDVDDAVGSFLIQAVCATEADVVVGDPFSCPPGSQPRDLRPGEALPYAKRDQPGPGNPGGFQGRDSFLSPDGRIINTFDFAPFGEFNPGVDGYDVIEDSGEFASIVGTRDPVGLAQTFFAPSSNSCRNEDGWLLFPNITDGSFDEVRHQLAIGAWERTGQPYPGACPESFDDARTWWLRTPVSFGGIGGSPTKALVSLISQHEGIGHAEKFFFTREYGFTRWERWEELASPRPARTEGCNGEAVTPTHKRVDCRDWTNIVFLESKFEPRSWPTPYAASNQLASGDFGDGIATWQRLGMSAEGATTNWTIAADNGGNHQLLTNCGGTCTAGQVVFQQVSRSRTRGAAANFGIAVSSEVPASGALVLFQLAQDGSHLDRHELRFSADGMRRLLGSQPLAVNPETEHFIFAVYLETSGATLALDDAWLVQQ